MFIGDVERIAVFFLRPKDPERTAFWINILL
jgi:hypothetical protein